MSIKSFFIAFAFIIPFWILEHKGIVPSYFFVPWLLVSVILQTFWTNKRLKKSFQKAEDITDGMFLRELSVLPDYNEELQYLGFTLTDQFYYSGISTSIVNAYSHKNNKDIFLIYIVNGKVTFECSTEFENDFSLSTCSSINCAVVPKPSKSFYCIENTTHLQNIYKRHQFENEFLKNKGYNAIEEKDPDIRKKMQEANESFYERAAQIKFFTIKLLYWTISRRGAVHLPSLAEQHKKGIISF